MQVNPVTPVLTVGRCADLLTADFEPMKRRMPWWKWRFFTNPSKSRQPKSPRVKNWSENNAGLIERGQCEHLNGPPDVRISASNLNSTRAPTSCLRLPDHPEAADVQVGLSAAESRIARVCYKLAPSGTADFAGAAKRRRGGAFTGGQHQIKAVRQGRVESTPTWLQQAAQLVQSERCQHGAGVRSTHDAPRCR